MRNSRNTFTLRSRDASLLSKLNERNVRYIVIGGVAVQYHGCREWHDIDDLDVFLRADDANAARFVGAMNGTNPMPTLVAAELAIPGRQIRLKGMCEFHADILTLSDDTFDDYAARAESVRVNGVEFQVLSKGDLIALKREDVLRLEKHKNDLECLQGKPG